MSATVHDAFDDAQSWRPEPMPEPASDTEEPITLALSLLRDIAESPFVSGRHRVRARTYFRKLKRAAAAPAVDELIGQ